MCGIAGIYNFKNKPIDLNILYKMNNTLDHRGPDDSETVKINHVGLGHKRLSIIDLSQLGHQPMYSKDKNYSIIFNGEIFNYKEIRKDLILKGIDFVSNSDTEVLLQGFITYGKEILHKLNGMFSFVIYSKKDNTLFCARDRVGIKPFYYHQNNKSFIFASEPKAIFEANVSNIINNDALEEHFIFRYVAGENTLFKNIKRLLPGHYLTITNDKITINRWWDLPTIIREKRKNIPSNPYEWFSKTFKKSISLRLISDVPIGILLSGGVDSTSIACEASKYNNNLSSFTSSFIEKGYDESHLAKEVAEKYKINFNKLLLKEDKLIETIKKASYFHDEPLVHHNDPQMLALCEYAKSKVTVLLSGEGADELMGGYVRYKALNILGKFPFLRLLRFILPNTYRFKKLKRYWKINDINELVMFNVSNIFQHDFDFLKNKDIKRFKYRWSVIEEAKKLYPKDLGRQAMYYDLFTHMASVLDRNDRMTMGASIECRVPFLDFRLIETISALPSKYLFKGKKGKFLLINSIGKKLPNIVIKFRKAGFEVPWEKYIQNSREFKKIIEQLPKSKLSKLYPFNQMNLEKLIKNIDLKDKNLNSLILRHLIFFSFYFNKKNN